MKLFAIVNMTLDHIGAYIFPEIAVFRALGRITFPVWFFLVGFSRSREIPASLWMYAGLLAAFHPFVLTPIFPLNALVTIILCRLLLNGLTRYGLLPGRLPEISILCVVLSPFANIFFEYGTTAFLFAIFGRMVREKETRYFRALTLAAFLDFIGLQLMHPMYNTVEAIYIVLGTALVVEWLSRAPNYVVWEDWRVSKAKTFLTVLSRNTLEYYFYHRLLLQFIGALASGAGVGFALLLYRW